MTDVHFLRVPALRRMLGKRALGLANLYVLGRKDYFDAARVVERAVADVLRRPPELFVLTGDLTALALDEEFEDARRAFLPLLSTLPSVVIPGNHDEYTRGAFVESRMERWFGPWMSGGTWDAERGAWRGGGLGAGGRVAWPVRFRLGDTDVVATNPCRPGLQAAGRFEPGAIERAEALVAESAAAGRQVVYLLHYPPMDADGTPYDGRAHGLSDARELLLSLRRSPPHLVLHGHKHRCWRVDLPSEDGRSVPVFNCGSSSAVSPLADRAAGWFEYELRARQLVSATRRMYESDGDRFVPHPGDFGPFPAAGTA
jgi:3',5'-cyclic AMP phosphodiesterase CpdA